MLLYITILIEKKSNKHNKYDYSKNTRLKNRMDFIGRLSCSMLQQLGLI